VNVLVNTYYYVLPLIASPIFQSLLDDTRDVLRNEAILVLISLIADNMDLQKIVAFEVYY
jgi:hypothetical protein